MAERWGRFVVGNFPWTAGATRPGPSPSPPVQDRARLQASSVEGEGILRNAASRSPRVIPREREVREPPLRRAPFALRKGWGTSDILRASGGRAAASGIPCERAVREPPLRHSSPFTRERDVYFLNWQPFRPGHPPLCCRSSGLRWLAPPSLCERGGWC